MKLSLALALGRMQMRGPGQAPGATITITPTFIDGVASGSEYDWLPEGAVWFADFENDHYYLGGEVTQSDLITISEAWGGGALTGTAHTLANANALIGAAHTIVIEAAISNLAEWIVGEWADVAPGGTSYVQLDGYDDLAELFDKEGVGSTVQTGADMVVGTNRIAVTIAGSEWAISINGNTAATAATTPYALAPVFQFMTTNSAIHSVAIYPPQAAAALPALSA